MILRKKSRKSTVWKLSEKSENFPYSLETVRLVWKLSEQSGNCVDGLETFQTV